MHANIAIWECDYKLTVYDKSQGPKSTQSTISRTFGVPEKNTPHSDINFKAVIIFAYFSVICETTLSSSEEIKIQ